MSHTSGGGHGHGGHHGVHGGHPDQSASWSSSLQSGPKPITSLPNPTILPIFFALFVFVIMLLPFCINWDDEGIELPWVHKRNQAALQQEQADLVEQAAIRGQATIDGQGAMQGQDAAPQTAQTAQPVSSAAPASYEQQLMYASRQSFAQNANQQTQAVNPAAQQTYAAQPNYQPAYPQDSYKQENYAQNYAPVAQPQQRHRVWVER